MQLLASSSNAIALLLLVSLAAYTDLRHRKIPNPLLVVGLGVGLALAALYHGTEGLLASLAGFALGFILLLPGYLTRFTGAGDLKLLATLGTYTGAGVILQVFVVSVLLSAGLILLWSLLKFSLPGIAHAYRRYTTMLLTLLTTGQWLYLAPAKESVLSRRLPMAPMYALSVVFVLTFSSEWSLIEIVRF